MLCLSEVWFSSLKIWYARILHLNGPLFRAEFYTSIIVFPPPPPPLSLFPLRWSGPAPCLLRLEVKELLSADRAVLTVQECFCPLSWCFLLCVFLVVSLFSLVYVFLWAPNPFVHFSQASRLSGLWLILVSFAKKYNLFNEMSANVFLDVLCSVYSMLLVTGSSQLLRNISNNVQIEGNGAVNLVIKVSNQTTDVFIFNFQPYLILCSIFSFVLWQHSAGFAHKIVLFSFKITLFTLGLGCKNVTLNKWFSIIFCHAPPRGQTFFSRPPPRNEILLRIW